MAAMRRAPIIVALAVFLGGAPDAFAQQDERPTVQRRFASKTATVYAHVTGTTHIRNDFYDSFGGGGDIGWYPSESLGFEARALFLATSLSPAARDVQERTGLTPDARPQSMMFTAGPRWSFGYGKILAFRRFVVHFDPQLVLEGGVTRAERRLLPTALAGASLLVHFRWGIQAKLDLNASIQGENRDRGWVPSIGFLPVIGVGWNLGLGGSDG